MSHGPLGDVELEKKSDHHQRRDEAGDAGDEERSAAEVVDLPDRHEREDDVDDANDDLTAERTAEGEAGVFENSRAVVDDGVDAADLRQKGERHPEQQGEADARFE